MMTSKVTYIGGLRTSWHHVRSGAEIITDAPVDNNGKGAAFSPTDTVATALASCMLTVIGIKAGDHQWEITGAYAEVTKTMAADPRRISAIEIKLHFPKNFDDKEKKLLQRTANSCPVLQSLHPDIKISTQFYYTLEEQ